MRAFYNEIDTYCCDWLSNLMDAGHITPGVICDKSIEDVFPDELRGFYRCHFFAGIGVWDYALNLAGWGERPVWTGSAPCQPFSAAGKGLGFADERHLWPAWHWLIQERAPATLFGEQVASKDVDPWIDLVFDDLEALGYACGATPFPSAGVGAPHIRDRTYFVADADYARPQGRKRVRERAAERTARSSGVASFVADADGGHAGAEGIQRSGQHGFLKEDSRVERIEPAGPNNGYWRDADWLLCRDEKWRPVEPGTFPLADGAPARVGRLRAYGNAINAQAAAEFIRAAREAIEL